MIRLESHIDATHQKIVLFDEHGKCNGVLSVYASIDPIACCVVWKWKWNRGYRVRDAEVVAKHRQRATVFGDEWAQQQAGSFDKYSLEFHGGDLVYL